MVYYSAFFFATDSAMHILITNDDGYLAPGIQILAEYLASIADITVVAPDRNKSGASNSLTLMPLYLAISGRLEQKPDMTTSILYNNGSQPSINTNELK